MEENQSVEAFYEECAALLGCDDAHCKRPEKYRKNRWCNRKPGAGRFVGFGIIRDYGKIHVSLRYPVEVNRWFDSREDVLDFLRGIREEASRIA